ncbi:hypothetical protein ACWPKO_11330 [Coraliomargarita sp. W4R53]
MIKTDFTFERFLEVVLPGAILVLGIWYFNRPFLTIYFPFIAGDAKMLDPENVGYTIRVFVITLTIVLAGIAIQNVSDIFVALAVEDESGSEKSKRKLRKIARGLFRLALITTARDPRVNSIERYMKSNRKEVFLSMLSTWAFTSSELLEKNKKEKVISHQHIVVRLKVLSPDSYSLLEKCYHPTRVWAGMVTSFCILFIVAITSFGTNYLVREEISVHSTTFLLMGSIGSIILLVVSCYFLRRAVIYFSSNVLTLALHHFSKQEQALNNDLSGRGMNA